VRGVHFRKPISLFADMRMKETKLYSALQTGIHALRWRICRS